MKGEIHELTQVFRTGMTTTESVGPFEINVVQSLKDSVCQLSRISFVSHLGTHMDAPRHYYEDGFDIADIPVDRLTGRCVVIDCIGKGEFGVIGIQDVINSGLDIKEGDSIFFCTGWQDYFSNVDSKFFNGSSISEELAYWLVDKKINIVGIDTCTVDLAHAVRPKGFDCPIHKILLSHGILITECLRLDDVAGKVLNFTALPMLIKEADGSPAHVIGIEL